MKAVRLGVIALAVATIASPWAAIARAEVGTGSHPAHHQGSSDVGELWKWRYRLVIVVPTAARHVTYGQWSDWMPGPIKLPTLPPLRLGHAYFEIQKLRAPAFLRQRVHGWTRIGNSDAHSVREAWG
jgi:hypothetical protein